MSRRLIAAVCLLVTTSYSLAADDAAKPQSAPPKFELRDGDRVVFLGNTLIERAQKYGYWETMLTARYPDRDITFRNLGWSGDTVWAESRGIFDPPAVGYKRMIEHVGRLKPTVIFVGYGNNEAFAGKRGLPAFIKQYNKLLDDLTGVSAEGVRFVVLSPLRHEERDSPSGNQDAVNRKIETYVTAIRKSTEKRRCFFADLYSTVIREPEKQFSDQWFSGPYTDNGIHLNNVGYSVANSRLEASLFHGGDADSRYDADEKTWQISLNAKSETSNKGNVPSLSALKFSDEVVQFKCIDSRMLGGNYRKLTVAGLPRMKAGLDVSYNINIDGNPLRGFWGCFRAPIPTGKPQAFDPERLQTGSLLQSPSDREQYEKLRQTIIEKNRLYFYRWRPQNITYLFGFRKHEQGQNAIELAEFDKLIAAKEAEINKLKKPVAHTYEIIRVKEDKKP